jgi:hypothetical protein
VAAIAAGRPARSGEEVLTPGQRRFEALALALRTPMGVPLEALPEEPELDGLVDRSSGRAVLTVRGRLLANAVTTRLVGDGPAAPTPTGPVADRSGPAGTIAPHASTGRRSRRA